MTHQVTLRGIKAATIEVECRRCHRHGLLERKKLVRLHGAIPSLEQLRRRLAMGCERISEEAADRPCELAFPGLLKVAQSAD
jgi:hypothetical protein